IENSMLKIDNIKFITKRDFQNMLQNKVMIQDFNNADILFDESHTLFTVDLDINKYLRTNNITGTRMIFFTGGPVTNTIVPIVNILALLVDVKIALGDISGNKVYEISLSDKQIEQISEACVGHISYFHRTDGLPPTVQVGKELKDGFKYIPILMSP